MTDHSLSADLLNQPLGTLARQLPGATAIFNRLQLGFCCQGKQTVQQVMDEKNLSAADLLHPLQTLIARQQHKDNLQSKSNSELIDYLLARYHQVHKEQLNELIRLADKVERVHHDKADCPKGLTAHLIDMGNELLQHMHKEEMVLFPMLKQGLKPLAPVEVMMAEHQTHQQAIDKLNALSQHQQAPKGACTTWRALYNGIND